MNEAEGKTMRSTKSSLLAAIALATLAGAGALAQAMPTPRKGGGRAYSKEDIDRSFARSAPPPAGPDAQRRAELRAEIAAHNAEVDRRRAEKRASKMARRRA